MTYRSRIVGAALVVGFAVAAAPAFADTTTPAHVVHHSAHHVVHSTHRAVKKVKATVAAPAAPAPAATAKP